MVAEEGAVVEDAVEGVVDAAAAEKDLPFGIPFEEAAGAADPIKSTTAVTTPLVFIVAIESAIEIDSRRRRIGGP